MIEIIPKTTKKMLPWDNVLLISAVFLLITAVLAYAVLVYFNNKSEDTIQGLEEEITQIGTPQDRVLEDNISKQAQNIKDFSTIFAGYLKTSTIFYFLETITHPKVWFSKLDFDAQTNQMSLTGSTQNFQTLGQQLTILKNQKFIQTIDLGSIDLGKEGQVNFTFNILLNKDIFQ